MKVFTVMDNRTDNVFGTFATERKALSFVNDMVAADFAMLALEEPNDTEKGLIWMGMVLLEQELNHGKENGYKTAEIFWDEEERIPVRIG